MRDGQMQGELLRDGDTNHRLWLTTRRTGGRFALPAVATALAAIFLLVAAGCNSSDVAEPAAEAPASTSEADSAAVIESSDAAARADSDSQPPATLSIGDPAPSLEIDTWVMGDAVDSDLNQGVYVVEFWATWCGPCLAGMPHISELQEHHGDSVTFVGITNEDVETVETFLDQESRTEGLWRDVIKYRLATDANGATNAAYMRAAKQNGIPTAFIVGPDGIVEWIGHPMSIDEPLQQVVDGNWDREAAILEFQQLQIAKEYNSQFRQWANTNDWETALAELDQIEQRSGPIPLLLNHRLKLYAELEKSPEESLAAVDLVEEKVGRNAQILQARWQILQSAGRQDETAEVLTELVELSWDNPRQLNSVAWNIVAGDGTPDLELAKRAAQRATELTDNESPSILDTLARIHYRLGDLTEAVRWQRLAVEQAKGSKEFQLTLEQYEAEAAKQADPDAADTDAADTDDSDASDADEEQEAVEDAKTESDPDESDAEAGESDEADSDASESDEVESDEADSDDSESDEGESDEGETESP